MGTTVMVIAEFVSRASITKYHNLDALKQQIYCLIVLEARSPKSMCRQGNPPSETCKAEFFLASS